MQAQLAVAADRVEDAFNISHDLQKQHEKLPVGFELEGDLQMRQKMPLPLLQPMKRH